MTNMEASKYRGTPKSSTIIFLSIGNHDFGDPPYYETYIYAANMKIVPKAVIFLIQRMLVGNLHVAPVL